MATQQAIQSSTTIREQVTIAVLGILAASDVTLRWATAGDPRPAVS